MAHLFSRDGRKQYGFDPYNSVGACLVWCRIMELLYADIAAPVEAQGEDLEQTLEFVPDYLKLAIQRPKQSAQWVYDLVPEPAVVERGYLVSADGARIDPDLSDVSY